MKTKHKDVRFLSLLAVMVASLLAVTIIASAGNVIIKNGGLNVSSNFYVDPTTGLVGVGTTSPGALLEVAGNIKMNSASSLVLNMTTGSPGPRIEMRNSIAPSAYGVIQYANTGVLQIGDSGWGGVINFNSTSGNVGIGTTNPGTNLVVYKTSSTPDTVWIENDGANGVTMSLRNSSNNGLNINVLPNNVATFWHAGDAQSGGLSILKGGNVGIGTTSPNVSLDVVGEIRASGMINAGSWTTGASNSVHMGFSAGEGYLAAYAAAPSFANLKLYGTNINLLPQGGSVTIGGVTAARVNTGTYTADNTNNRAIAHGLGVTPKTVIVMVNAGGVGCVEQTSTNWNPTSNLLSTETVTAWDSTNFYVSAGCANQGAAVRYWTAWG